MFGTFLNVAQRYILYDIQIADYQCLMEDNANTVEMNQNVWPDTFIQQ